jgi:hypothetical protein
MEETTTIVGGKTITHKDLAITMIETIYTKRELLRMMFFGHRSYTTVKLFTMNDEILMASSSTDIAVEKKHKMEGADSYFSFLRYPLWLRIGNAMPGVLKILLIISLMFMNSMRQLSFFEYVILLFVVLGNITINTHPINKSTPDAV